MNGHSTTARQYEALRRLERENEALRTRLARHEFRRLEQELSSEHPFRLDIHGAKDDPADIGLPVVDNPLLLCLPVPAGTIQKERPSPDLPVIAVHDDGLKGRPLAAALLGLLKAQYSAPFARFVFLCSGYDAVPLLGRYGFIAEHIGDADPASHLARLHRRHGVSQVRSLGSGQLIAERRGV